MIAADQDRRAVPADQLKLGRLLQGTEVVGRRTNAWLSTEAGAPAWDNFLRGTDLGQFQQSSLWAQAKQVDGWQSLRLILEQEQRIVGGFQILWRRTRFGRVGYIIKGPV